MQRTLYLNLTNKQTITWCISYSNKGFLHYGGMKTFGDLERILDSTKAIINEHEITHVICHKPAKGLEEYSAILKLALLQLKTSYDTKTRK